MPTVEHIKHHSIARSSLHVQVTVKGPVWVARKFP